LSGHALMFKEDDTASADGVSFQDQVYATEHPSLLYTMHHTFSAKFCYSILMISIKCFFFIDICI
jgi:hypothetical protein